MPRYSAIVMDHFENPRHAGRMAAADVVGRAEVRGGRAPRIALYVQLAPGSTTEAPRIARASFETFGCGAAIAASSMLVELVAGQSVADCHAITPATLLEALGGLPDEKTFCAALAVAALHDALRQLDSPAPARGEFSTDASA
jgi:nitrogen fixation NifU-like protein